MDSSTVIKVKYAETVRRFSTCVVDGKFDLNMDRLREKIVGLFKFSPGTELRITYLDEDGDVVTLVDDEDLHDVVRQGLNPLRITVTTGRSGESSSSGGSGNFTQLTASSWLQQRVQNLNIEDPLRRLLTDCIMLMNHFSGHQSGPDAPAHGVSTNETVSGDTRDPKINEAGKSGVAGPAATANVLSDNQSENFFQKTDEVKCQSVSAGARKIPGLESIRDALASVSGEASPVGLKPRTLPRTDIGTNKSTKQPPLVGAAPVSENVRSEKKESTTPSVLKPNSVSDCFLQLKNGTRLSLNFQNSQPISTPCDGTKIAPGNVLRTLKCSSGNSSTSNPSPSRACSVIEMPLRNASAVPVPPLPFISQPRRNHRRGDNPVMTFHRGVRCDGCGVHPITGVRFKSKVKEDYDLCSFCFGQMGNEDDYIRLDRPLTYNRHTSHCKGSFEPRRTELDSIFTQDVTISDGTLMAPLIRFTKIWRMKNSGAVVWPRGTQLVWIGGDKLTDMFSVELEIPDDGFPVGEELDIAVDFLSPRHPGQYISYWRMISPSGHKFGQRVWVLIQVDVNELPHDGYYSLNLNLPPVSNGVSNPETINVNPELTVKNSLPDTMEFVGSSGTADLVEPTVASPVQKVEEQVNLPIDDSSFVGGAVSKPYLSTPSSSSSSSLSFSYPIIDLPETTSAAPPSLLSFSHPIIDLPDTASAAPPSLLSFSHPIIDLPDTASAAPPSSSSISYPIVDLFETAPPLPASEPVPLTVVQTSSTDLGLTPEVEEALLRDLEEMGFSQVDLNKEILRLNEYDLEKSVDDLCGVSEWDPILDELKEMGFCDQEKNRKLLKKNNGSVKRVVMDLLGGEKMM